jgi:hypothetical protein
MEFPINVHTATLSAIGVPERSSTVTYCSFFLSSYKHFYFAGQEQSRGNQQGTENVSESGPKKKPKVQPAKDVDPATDGINRCLDSSRQVAVKTWAKHGHPIFPPEVKTMGVQIRSPEAKTMGVQVRCSWSSQRSSEDRQMDPTNNS